LIIPAVRYGCHDKRARKSFRIAEKDLNHSCQGLLLKGDLIIFDPKRSGYMKFNELREFLARIS
jgi:hypothetical protein